MAVPYAPRWIAASLILLLCSPAFAVDGVLEINQTCAAYAGDGCFPGDLAEPPVTIDQPGSYRLTSNLYVEAVNLPAVIEIRADHVTLDLNGFMISGPTVCSGTPPGPVSCIPSGSLDGITTDTDRTGIVVRNGFVRGMPYEGVDLGLATESRVEHVNAISNGSNGIHVGERSTVRDCLAQRNEFIGIATGVDSVVMGNNASGNGNVGISASSGTILHNEARGNTSDGINAGGLSNVRGNTASNNGRNGILVYGRANVAENAASFNSADGIQAASGLGIRIHGNVIGLNGDDGIDTFSCTGCSVTGNTSQENKYGMNLAVDTARGGNVVSGSTTLDITGAGGTLLECDMEGGTRVCPP